MATSAPPLWSPPLPSQQARGNSKTVVNSKVMVVAVAVLFAVVLFILCLHIYAKWFWRHQAARATLVTQTIHRGRAGAYVPDPVDAAHSVGLERALVEALPTFQFSGENKFECAVCLEDFEAGEKGRTLPLCGHAFHLDCIDMWLHSHSTCPLCRTSITAETKPELQSHEPTIVGAPFMAAMRASRRRQRSVSSLNSLPRTDEAENPGTETDTGAETMRLPPNLKETDTGTETGLGQNLKEYETTSSAPTAEESRPGIRAPFQVSIDIEPRSGLGFGNNSNNPASVMSPMARASASFRRLLSRGKSVVAPQSDEGGPSSPRPPSPAGAAAIV